MYKDRFRKWKIEKKNKEAEARAIMHMHNLLQDKSTQLRLRGRLVDVRKIERYFSRKKISATEVLNCPATEVSGLTFMTPSDQEKTDAPGEEEVSSGTETSNLENRVVGNQAVVPVNRAVIQTSPMQTASPDAFKQAESVFSLIHEYIFASFGLGYWISKSQDEFCWNSKTVGLENGTNPYYNEVCVACKMIWKNELGQAKDRLNQSLVLARKLVDAQAMRALPYVVESLAILVANGYVQVAVEMLRQLSCTPTMDGVVADVTTVIFKRIFGLMMPLVANDNADGFLLAIVRSLVGSYDRILGPSHLQTTESLSIQTRVAGCLYGHVGLEIPLNILYKVMVDQHGPENVRSLSVLLDIANVQMQCHDFVSAEVNALKSVEGALVLRQTSRTHGSLSLLCDSHYIAGQSQQEQGNVAAADASYRKALEISEKEWGVADLDTIGYRTILYKLLLSQGEQDQAVALRLQGPIEGFQRVD